MASLSVRPGALLGRTLHINGSVPGLVAGAPVAVQRQLLDGTWADVATTAVDRDGRFDTTWLTDHIGRQTLRALPAGRDPQAAQAASTQALGRVTIFKPGVATYFGPGFYGQQTACGQKLTRKLLGVAHRTLPCGTLVDLYYKGQTITVPVVDRGPFRAGTTWDLTTAAAKALDMTETARIGAVRVRG